MKYKIHNNFVDSLITCEDKNILIGISCSLPFLDLTLLVEDLYRVMYYNKVKMEDDFVAVLTSMLSVETIGKKLIGRNQNLFQAIERHFAMQSDKEKI